MKREWYDEFKETLIKREKKSIPKVRKSLKQWYEKVMKEYSHEKSAEELSSLFLDDDAIKAILEDMYVDIYVGMGRWNVKKYIEQKSELREIIAFLKERGLIFANIEALTRAELIKIASRNAIQKVIERLREDERFLLMNERSAVRELSKEFRELSRVQSTRIVRTEATKVANHSLLDSTVKLFPGKTLKKEWLSAKDSRTRYTHREADGQQVLQRKKFFVGGEFLDVPGSGVKPENNIGCRCAVIPVRL